MSGATDPTPLRPYLPLAVVIILGAFAFGLWRVGPWQDGGAVETVTVAALFLVAGLHILRLPSLALGSEWHIPALACLLAMPALEFDKRFTDHGVLNPSVFARDTSWMGRAVAAGLILLVGLCLIRLIRRDGPVFRAALRDREGWSSALIAAPLAWTLHESGSRLAALGLDIPSWSRPIVLMAEKTFELAFATALLAALFLWIRRHA